MSQLRSNMGEAPFASAERYWRQQLARPWPDLAVLTPTSAELRSTRAACEVPITDEVSSRLLAICSGDEDSLLVVFVAMYSIHLARLGYGRDAWRNGAATGMDTVVLVPALEALADGATRYMAARVTARRDASLKQILASVRDTVVVGHDHAVFGARELTELARLDNPAALCRHVVLSNKLHSVEQVMHDLSKLGGEFVLAVGKTDAGVRATLHLSTPGAMPASAERIALSLAALVDAAAKDPACAIDQLPTMTVAEQQAVMACSRGATVVRDVQTVVELFEARARMCPDAIAVQTLTELDNIYDRATPRMSMESVTYDALNARANQIARTLRDAGVGADDVVALLVDGCIGKVEATLGVLKAGAAYLPIDCRHPVDYIKRLLDDAGARAIIIEEERMASALADPASPRVILSTASPELNKRSAANLGERIAPEQACYVCFTSGTTGATKGVVVEHRGLANYVQWRVHALAFDERARTLQMVPYTADGSCANLFPTLAAGGVVVMVPESRQSDAEYVRQVLARFAVTNMSLVPSALASWLDGVTPDQVKALEWIALAGEVANDAVLEQLGRLAPRARIVNEYGPTETTVAATLSVGLTPATNTVIGRPIDNTTVMVVSGSGEPTPPGIVGEICIAGPGVARGYLKDPELTQLRFGTDAAGRRMYRTGDLATWGLDGRLHYHGRMDRQKKLRGHRVDIDYLERRIGDLADGADVHIRLDDERGESAGGCTAYVATQDVSMPGVVRQRMERELPSWMVPSRIVGVARIPRTATGRVDIDALPSATHEDAPAPAEAPQTESEHLIAGMFTRVLRLPPELVGRTSNFFDLGGNSITLTQLAALIHAELRVHLRPSVIYENPTVAAIAKHIAEAGRSNPHQITRAPESPDYATSSAQERMYVMRYAGVEPAAYNIPLLVDLKDRVDADRLEAALRCLIERHETLRTSFERVGGRLRQRIHGTAPFALDRREVSLDEAQGFLNDFLRPFDLDRPPLLRAMLLRVRDAHDLLFLETHHIANDGESMMTLLREMKTLYDGGELSSLTLQYKDFAEWQVAREAAGALVRQERFWRHRFADGIPSLDLPTDMERPRTRILGGAFLEATLDASVTAHARALAKAVPATMSSLLFGVYAALLSRWAKQDDFVVGLSVSGRLWPAVRNLIGNFAGTVPVRFNVDRSMTFKQFLSQVAQDTLLAYENQEYSLDRLVDALDVRRDPSRNPFFDCVFQYVEADVEREVTPTGLTVGELSPSARFRDGRALHIPVRPMFDLLLDTTGRGRTVSIRLGYSDRLWREQTARAVLSQLVTLVKRVVDDPNVRIADLQLDEMMVQAVSVGLSERDDTAFQFGGSST